MNIACLVPPIQALVNEAGHGYMPPLGLLTVAGPLIDAGFRVVLVDADAGHLSMDQVVARLRECKINGERIPDKVLLPSSLSSLGRVYHDGW